MVNFSDDELEYIEQQFTDVMNKVNNLHGEDLLDYINSAGRECINFATEYLELDDKSDININEDLNVMAKHSIYWILGFWVWSEGYMTGEEVKHYVDNNFYCSIYDKIILDDEEYED